MCYEKRLWCLKIGIAEAALGDALRYLKKNKYAVIPEGWKGTVKRSIDLLCGGDA